MAITIISAVYRSKKGDLELRTTDIDIDTYNKKYKGNLYCPMPNCNAKLEFVYGSERPSYFRTWKHDNHDDNCLYRFDRVTGKQGVSTEYTLDIVVSETQKKNALKDAFRLSQMTPEQIEDERTKRRHIRTTPKTEGKERQVALNPVINSDSSNNATVEGRRGPNLLKRTVNSLRESDINKVRVLIGNVIAVKHSPKSATLDLEYEGKTCTAHFEEAFFANSPTYDGLFHHIETYLEKYEKGIFTGAGDVRLGEEGSYEFVVYHGDDFNIDNMNLRSIAAHFARGSL